MTAVLNVDTALPLDMQLLVDKITRQLATVASIWRVGGLSNDDRQQQLTAFDRVATDTVADFTQAQQQWLDVLADDCDALLRDVADAARRMEDQQPHVAAVVGQHFHLPAASTASSALLLQDLQLAETRSRMVQCDGSVVRSSMAAAKAALDAEKDRLDDLVRRRSTSLLALFRVAPRCFQDEPPTENMFHDLSLSHIDAKCADVRNTLNCGRTWLVDVAERLKCHATGVVWGQASSLLRETLARNHDNSDHSGANQTTHDELLSSQEFPSAEGTATSSSTSAIENLTKLTVALRQFEAAYAATALGQRDEYLQHPANAPRSSSATSSRRGSSQTAAERRVEETTDAVDGTQYAVTARVRIQGLDQVEYHIPQYRLRTALDGGLVTSGVMFSTAAPRSPLPTSRAATLPSSPILSSLLLTNPPTTHERVTDLQSRATSDLLPAVLQVLSLPDAMSLLRCSVRGIEQGYGFVRHVLETTLQEKTDRMENLYEEYFVLSGDRRFLVTAGTPPPVRSATTLAAASPSFAKDVSVATLPAGSTSAPKVLLRLLDRAAKVVDAQRKEEISAATTQPVEDSLPLAHRIARTIRPPSRSELSHLARTLVVSQGGDGDVAIPITGLADMVDCLIHKPLDATQRKLEILSVAIAFADEDTTLVTGMSERLRSVLPVLSRRQRILDEYLSLDPASAKERLCSRKANSARMIQHENDVRLAYSRELPTIVDNLRKESDAFNAFTRGRYDMWVQGTPVTALLSTETRHAATATTAAPGTPIRRPPLAVTNAHRSTPTAISTPTASRYAGSAAIAGGSARKLLLLPTRTTSQSPTPAKLTTGLPPMPHARQTGVRRGRSEPMSTPTRGATPSRSAVSQPARPTSKSPPPVVSRPPSRSAATHSTSPPPRSVARTETGGNVASATMRPTDKGSHAFRARTPSQRNQGATFTSPAMATASCPPSDAATSIQAVPSEAVASCRTTFRPTKAAPTGAVDCSDGSSDLSFIHNEPGTPTFDPLLVKLLLPVPPTLSSLVQPLFFDVSKAVAGGMYVPAGDSPPVYGRALHSPPLPADA